MRSVEKAFRRRFHRRARLLVAVVIVGGTFSAPAMACLCSCSIFSTPAKSATATPVTSVEYDQVFSGLVISTERTREPVRAPVALNDKFVLDPGYWIKSKVLVLRIWRGTPSTVAEVWTPILSDCDVQPIAGFHFVALVRTEKGRSVAGNTFCDCVEKAAATSGRGTFAVAGIAITAATVATVAIALLLLVRLIRRRRPSG